MMYSKSRINKNFYVKAINSTVFLLLLFSSGYTFADETAFNAVNKIAIVARQFTVDPLGYSTGAKYSARWEQPMTWTESSASGPGFGVGAVSISSSRLMRNREKGSTERLQEAMGNFSVADMLRDKLGAELLKHKDFAILDQGKVMVLYNELCPQNNTALSCHKSEWAKNGEEATGTT